MNSLRIGYRIHAPDGSVLRDIASYAGPTFNVGDHIGEGKERLRVVRKEPIADDPSVYDVWTEADPAPGAA